MSLLIGLIRKRMCREAKFDAAWQLTLISQSIRAVQGSTDYLNQQKTDYESQGKETKLLQERLYKLNIMEKQLKEKQDSLQLRIQECDNEIKACDEMIKEGISTFFSYKAA